MTIMKSSCNELEQEPLETTRLYEIVRKDEGCPATTYATVVASGTIHARKEEGSSPPTKKQRVTSPRNTKTGKSKRILKLRAKTVTEMRNYMGFEPKPPHPSHLCELQSSQFQQECFSALPLPCTKCKSSMPKYSFVLKAKWSTRKVHIQNKHSQTCMVCRYQAHIEDEDSTYTGAAKEKTQKYRQLGEKTRETVLELPLEQLDDFFDREVYLLGHNVRLKNKWVVLLQPMPLLSLPERSMREKKRAALHQPRNNG
eukprot:g68728.t1